MNDNPSATGQSKTPRTDAAAYASRQWEGSFEYGSWGIDSNSVDSDFARTLETELTAALAQRDEARRLLEEAKASLIRTAYWMAEQTGADEPPYPEPENFCACNHCTEYGELLTLLSRVEQITNHLKPA